MSSVTPVTVAPPYRLREQIDRWGTSWYIISSYRTEIREYIQNQPTEQWLRVHGRLDENGYEIDGVRWALDFKLYTIIALSW